MASACRSCSCLNCSSSPSMALIEYTILYKRESSSIMLFFRFCFDDSKTIFRILFSNWVSSGTRRRVLLMSVLGAKISVLSLEISSVEPWALICSCIELTSACKLSSFSRNSLICLSLSLLPKTVMPRSDRGRDILPRMVSTSSTQFIAITRPCTQPKYPRDPRVSPRTPGTQRAFCGRGARRPGGRACGSRRGRRGCRPAGPARSR